MASTMVSKVAMANDLGFGFGLAINKASHDYSTKLRPHRSHKYDKDAPKEYNSGKQRMHRYTQMWTTQFEGIRQWMDAHRQQQSCTPEQAGGVAMWGERCVQELFWYVVREAEAFDALLLGHHQPELQRGGRVLLQNMMPTRAQLDRCVAKMQTGNTKRAYVALMDWALALGLIPLAPAQPQGLIDVAAPAQQGLINPAAPMQQQLVFAAPMGQQLFLVGQQGLITLAAPAQQQYFDFAPIQQQQFFVGQQGLIIPAAPMQQQYNDFAAPAPQQNAFVAPFEMQQQQPDNVAPFAFDDAFNFEAYMDDVLRGEAEAN